VDNKPQAIIVTFPVQFLCDLAYSILENNYRLAYQAKRQYKFRNFKKEKLNVYTEQQPNVILNSRKNMTIMGFKECIRQINECMINPEVIWYHGMKNRPTADVLHCYVNILGKIRYRFKIIGFAPGGEMEFEDVRKKSFQNWLLLHMPEKIKEIKMGGFQGFRYWKEDY
jgi:hypothetical protein